MTPERRRALYRDAAVVLLVLALWAAVVWRYGAALGLWEPFR